MKITGTIVSVRDYGSLVLIFLDTDDGRTIPVPMDRQAFQRLLERGACRPADLIGRSVAFDGDLMTFLG